METTEETAWALRALLAASESDPGVRALASDAIERAGGYLERTFTDRAYPSLWIGKSLYAPPNIVRATVLSALLGWMSFVRRSDPS